MIFCLVFIKFRVTLLDKMLGVNVYVVVWFIGIFIGVILFCLGKCYSIIFFNFLV